MWHSAISNQNRIKNRTASWLADLLIRVSVACEKSEQQTKKLIRPNLSQATFAFDRQRRSSIFLLRLHCHMISLAENQKSFKLYIIVFQIDFHWYQVKLPVAYVLCMLRLQYNFTSRLHSIYAEMQYSGSIVNRYSYHEAGAICYVSFVS